MRVCAPDEFYSEFGKNQLDLSKQTEQTDRQMIFFFEIPQILDDTKIAELAKPEQKANSAD